MQNTEFEHAEDKKSLLKKRLLLVLFLVLIIGVSSAFFKFFGAEEILPQKMVKVDHSDRPINVLMISKTDIPEMPKPNLKLTQQTTENQTDSVDRPKAQFSASHHPTDYLKLPEGEFVRRKTNQYYVNPYEGHNIRSIEELEEMPHYDDCLSKGAYSPVTFSCTKDKVFNFVKSNMHVPKCVEYSGGVQIVLALVILNEQGEVIKVDVLNSDVVCSDCSMEAKRILRELPKLNPGKFGGSPVKFSFQIPIRFEAL